MLKASGARSLAGTVKPRQPVRQILTIVVMVTITLVLLLMALVGHYVWQLHQWVPAGQAFAMGNWHFGDCEFQVWQRKTWHVTEPFADGLFVRHGSNGWEAFCFDIQDSYLPRVKLVPEKGQIVVYRDGENRAVYDMATHTFQRHGQAYSPMGIGNDTTPPGEWMVKE